MSRHIVLPALAFCFLALASCGRHGETSIEASFKNLGDAECYIFSEWMGETRFDTLRLSGGKFTYTYPLADTTILTLQYPNFLQLHFIAAPGQSIRIKGDATHLRATRVTGSRDNELLTEFRFSLFDKSEAEQIQLAEDFIKAHPETVAAQAVFEQYFLKARSLDYTKARHLLRRMQEAAPERPWLKVLSSRLSPMLDHGPGKQFPTFEYTTDDSLTLTNHTFSGKPFVVWFWSSWRQEYLAPVRESRDMLRSRSGKLLSLNICLDTDTAEFHRVMRRDTLEGYNVCDRLGWDTPLAVSFGVSRLPVAALVGADGKVIARDLDREALDAEVAKILPI